MTYLSISSSNLKIYESISSAYTDAGIRSWLVALVVKFMIQAADRPEFYVQVCFFPATEVAYIYSMNCHSSLSSSSSSSSSLLLLLLLLVVVVVVLVLLLLLLLLLLLSTTLYTH